ncbi:hypothetical protein ON010_g13494 [Phytophthora cinnamomi]|nr:hypothetical protein ON010_g13494 [Phytophthora cinnamomi]
MHPAALASDLRRARRPGHVPVAVRAPAPGDEGAERAGGATGRKLHARVVPRDEGHGRLGVPVRGPQGAQGVLRLRVHRAHDGQRQHAAHQQPRVPVAREHQLQRHAVLPVGLAPPLPHLLAHVLPPPGGVQGVRGQLVFMPSLRLLRAALLPHPQDAADHPRHRLKEQVVQLALQEPEAVEG